MANHCHEITDPGDYVQRQLKDSGAGRVDDVKALSDSAACVPTYFRRPNYRADHLRAIDTEHRLRAGIEPPVSTSAVIAGSFLLLAGILVYSSSVHHNGAPTHSVPVSQASPQSKYPPGSVAEACQSATKPAATDGGMPEVDGYIQCLITHQVAEPRMVHPTAQITIRAFDRQGRNGRTCGVAPGGTLTEITPDGIGHILVNYTAPAQKFPSAIACTSNVVGFVSTAVFDP